MKNKIFLNHIYGLLVMQGFEKGHSQFFEVEPALIKVYHRLLKGPHIDDLGVPGVADNAGPSSVANSTDLAIDFLEKGVVFGL